MQDKILNTIGDFLGLDQVQKNQYFYDDLNIDPLDFADLILKIEQKYKLTIPKDEIIEIKKVDDLIKIIEDNDPDFN